MRLKGGLYFNFDVRVIKNFSFQDCQFGNIKAVHKGAVQGEVKVKEKTKRQNCGEDVVSYKTMQKLIWLNSGNSCSEMLRKNFVLTGVVEAALIQVFSLHPGPLRKTDSITNISVRYFEIIRNSFLTRGTTVISCLSSLYVHCAAIPHQYKQ